MSYKLPSVSVFQILLRASQDLADSELLPCFVGSLNQVVTDYSISLPLPVSSPTVIYPNLKIGAIVDNTSVSISVKNPVVKIDSGTLSSAITVSATNPTRTMTSAKFTSAQVGDKVVFDNNLGTFTIKSISSTTVTIADNEVFSTGLSTSNTFSILRSISDTVICSIGSPTYSSNSFSFTSLKYNGYEIQSGLIYLSYVALRKDLTGFYEVTNQDSLRVDIDVAFANPLGYYLGTVAPAANGGKKILAYILSDESDSSYVAALSDLSTRKDAYLLVPLSSSSIVKNAFAAHAITMSQPESSYFRSALLNSTLTTQQTVSSSVTYTKA